MCILTSMNIFLVFQIKINAANNSNKRHKTKHNQCSHIIYMSHLPNSFLMAQIYYLFLCYQTPNLKNSSVLSLLRFLQHVTERVAPPPREGDSEQVGGQACPIDYFNVMLFQVCPAHVMLSKSGASPSTATWSLLRTSSQPPSTS